MERGPLPHRSVSRRYPGAASDRESRVPDSALEEIFAALRTVQRRRPALRGAAFDLPAEGNHAVADAPVEQRPVAGIVRHYPSQFLGRGLGELHAALIASKNPALRPPGPLSGNPVACRLGI